MGQIAGGDRLNSLIRDISRVRLEQQAKINQVAIVEMSDRPPVFAHWMSIILVTGQEVRITFKAHFKTKVAQHFASGCFGKTAEQISLPQAIDFMREYCNLTAGGIKASLIAHGVGTAISLPIVTRGFDEIFFVSGPDALEDFWKLSNSDGEITCSTLVESYSHVDFSTLVRELGSESENSDVEFF